MNWFLSMVCTEMKMYYVQLIPNSSREVTYIIPSVHLLQSYRQKLLMLPVKLTILIKAVVSILIRRKIVYFISFDFPTLSNIFVCFAGLKKSLWLGIDLVAGCIKWKIHTCLIQGKYCVGSFCSLSKCKIVRALSIVYFFTLRLFFTGFNTILLIV